MRIALLMLLSLWLAVGAGTAGAETLLASGGKARAVVVAPAGGSPVEEFAARELARYLGRVAGAEFAVVETAPGTGTELHVGSTAAARAEGVAYAGPFKGDDAFVIRTRGRRVFLRGAGPRGTLYAVYHLLQRTVGCRWVMPGEPGEVLPSKPELSLPELDVSREPAFTYRICAGFANPEDVDWLAKHGMHLWSHRGDLTEREDVVERGVAVHGTMHHAFDKIVDETLYGRAHPEYFGLLNGRRVVERSIGAQPCVSNDEVVALTLRAAVEFFRKNPKAEFYSLCPNDNQNWCECERCRAYDSETMERFGRIWPIVSDRYFAYVRKVALALEKACPGKKLYCFAYQTYTDPPKKVDLPPNVIVSLCHMVPACYAHPLNDPDCEENARFDRLLRGWAQRGGELWFYAYTCKSMWQDMPWPIARRLAVDIRHLRAQGFRGFYSQGSAATWGQLGPNMYVMGELLWDPDADVDALLGDYFEHAFGPAAPAVERYWRTLEAAFTRPGNFIHHEAFDQAPAFMTPGVRRACDRALAEAEKLAAPDAVRRRLAPVAGAWEYAKLYLDGEMAARRYRGNGDVADLRTSVAAYRRIVEIGKSIPGAVSPGAIRRYVEPPLQIREAELRVAEGTGAVPVEVANSSFEEPLERGEWSTGKVEGRDVAREKPGTEGEWGLRLRVADDPKVLPPSDWVTLSASSAVIPAQRGHVYVVTADVRIPKAFAHTKRGAVLGLFGMDAEGKSPRAWAAGTVETTRLELTEGWVKLRCITPRVPPNVTRLRVRLGMAGAGECWFDNVQLVTIPPEP